MFFQFFPERPNLRLLAQRATAGSAVTLSVHVALGCCLLGPVPPAAAQSGTDANLLRLETKRKLLEERRNAEKTLSADVSALRSEREQINQSLVDMARQIQAGEGQLTTIEARLSELEAQEKLLRGSLVQRHDQIARLLAAMQRMGRNPPPVMITKREDALQMVRSAMMLASAFPEMRDQALALAGRLNELARVMGESRAEGDRQKTETQRLNDQRTQLAVLMENKRQLMTERQGELDKIRREAAEISKGVGDLNELIVKLDRAVARHTGQDIAVKTASPESAPTEAPDTTPPQPVAVAPTAVAPTPQSPSPPAKPVVVASVTPPPAAAAPPLRPSIQDRPSNAIELAPKGTQVASMSAGRLKPAFPFAQMRARLHLPAQGRRVLAFGEKTQYGERSKGIVLETRQNGQITAPSDAWVVFAGEFRTFGQLLIMNAGDGYHILLAGLSQIDVQLGDFVLAGQPVGVMTGPAMGGKTKAADSAPVLYIEFRKDSRPIDPDPWWVEEARQKVQG